MTGKRPGPKAAPGNGGHGSTAPAAARGASADSRVEKFLQAAIEVFLEKGYRNARLSDIVARSGGSLATLYQAYGSKKGLAHAIMERCIGGFAQSLQKLQDSPLPPEQALPIAAED
ncbi:MAG: TetR/AcrR family transcriptional regulator, partial [Pseudoxanthomonas sp.]|nr:TetR/AcrR family transcriptional regulator [Pseudoxanthomonas sp.]